MAAEPEYRTDAERMGDLLVKKTDGPDEEVSNLTAEEEAELEELWHSQGYDLLVGPYHPVPGQDEAEDFRTMPLDPDRPFLEQFERRALWDEKCRKWLETEVYTDLELMKEWDPGSVMLAEALARQDGKTTKCAEKSSPPPAEDEFPRPPPPPIMTWEEIEQEQSGQLDFPALISTPTVAERAFLALAREWQAEVERSPKDSALPRAVDVRALSCLLLAVEWGADFTSVARDQMETNRLAAEGRREMSWMDQLSWNLCLASSLVSPSQCSAMQELTANLDHHNSSIRCWMMEIGWFAVPWLNPVEAAVRLLKNLADTLAGPFMAAGLAARFFDNADGFLGFARHFKPPDSFAEQYRNRLKYVEEHGIREIQAPFWETEAICRKAIEQAGLGFRKAGEHRT